MTDWNRRSLLATGAVLSTGLGLASIGAGRAGDTDEPLPDPSVDPNPHLNEDWAVYRGDAGHTRCIEDGYEFDATLEAAWSVDHDGSVAVADDVVYTSTADGVIAVEAGDGSIAWENTDVAASDPAVAGDVVCLTTDDGVVALDRASGSLEWERTFDLGSEETVTRHTVAYDGVYVVANGTLYALETTDGSTWWRIDSVTLEMATDGWDGTFEFSRSPAAANGVVYAATQRSVHAFDPGTGDEVWREAEVYEDGEHAIHANPAAVIVDGWSDLEQGVHDAQTGETKQVITSETSHEMALDEEIYTTGHNFSFNVGWFDDHDQGWEISCANNPGQAVICGDVVYVYFGRPEGDWGEYEEELVALDKADGTEKWSIATADAPVGYIRAISGDTLYVDHEGELVAFREAGRGESDDAGDEDDAQDGDNGTGGDQDDGQNDETDPSDDGEASKRC